MFIDDQFPSPLRPGAVHTLSRAASPRSRPLQPAEYTCPVLQSVTSSSGSLPGDGVSAHDNGDANSAYLCHGDGADISHDTSPSVIGNLLLLQLNVYFVSALSLRLSLSPGDDVVILHCVGIRSISCSQLFSVYTVASTTCPAISAVACRHITGLSAVSPTLTSTDEIQHEDNWCDEHVETHCFMLLTMSSYDDGLITTDIDNLTNHDHWHVPLIWVLLLYTGQPRQILPQSRQVNQYLAVLDKP